MSNLSKTPFQCPAVKHVYDRYPSRIQSCILSVREWVFDCAQRDPRVGQLEETLKWGEPSYLTPVSHSGSTLRLAWHPKYPNQYGLYVNCRTRLIDIFKETQGDLFRYEGNRAILFDIDDTLPQADLCDCITMILTYHLSK